VCRLLHQGVVDIRSPDGCKAQTRLIRRCNWSRAENESPSSGTDKFGQHALTSTYDYDVVIIGSGSGSGFGGSVAALRAAEKGYRVGVMEAGYSSRFFTSVAKSSNRRRGVTSTCTC
jgi:hypothetical protein